MKVSASRGPLFYLSIWLFLTLAAQAQILAGIDTAPRTRIDGTGQERDKYKFVFPASYDGKIKQTYSTYDAIIYSQRKNLVDEMNRLGSAGYRMKFFAALKLPVGIVASDDGTFEYDWFETTSNSFFAKSGLDEKLDALAAKEFYLADHTFIGSACDTNYPLDPFYIEKCTYVDLFIVEKDRKKGKKTQIIVGSAPGWKARPSDELTKAINRQATDGFYPAAVLSKFEIVLEKGSHDDVIREKTEYRVVSGGDLQKKVNELAHQGFRLLLVDNGIALLYHNSKTAGEHASYVWVDVRNKNFEEEIAKLERTGSHFSLAYPNARGEKDTLIFEINPKDTIAGEYKVLGFDFDFKEDQAANKVNIDLTAQSRDAVRQMNALANEGFELKALFWSGKINVILERHR